MDFAQEVKLDSKEKRIYILLRAGLFILFIAGAFYTAFVILFPAQYFSFNFANFNSTKNTVLRPRFDENPANRGNVPQNKSLYFDTALPGNYSIAEINFNLNKKSSLPVTGNIEVKKSYQAFFYSESNDHTALPQAVSLISYADSVYAASGKFIYPFDSAITFEAMGYNWTDVIPTSADEISAFEKGKLLTLFSAHPDGTVFIDNGNYFIIKDGKKILLTQAELSAMNMKIIPIAVSSSDSSISENCKLEKNFLNKKKYFCEIPVAKFKDLIGKDYEFKTDFSADVKIDSIDVRFKQNINLFNLKATAGLIITRIKNNYVGE